MLHNYRSRQVHETLNRVNPSSGFRVMSSAKSGPKLRQIWQFFGPWKSPYGENGQMTMTVHNYRTRQFHRTLNGENPSSGYRDMSSASLAAVRLPVTTIPLKPEGLRGKKQRNVSLHMASSWYKFSWGNNLLMSCPCAGIILGMGLANERCCYIVMASLIGWAHTQNDPRCDLSVNNKWQSHLISPSNF